MKLDRRQFHTHRVKDYPDLKFMITELNEKSNSFYCWSLGSVRLFALGSFTSNMTLFWSMLYFDNPYNIWLNLLFNEANATQGHKILKYKWLNAWNPKHNGEIEAVKMPFLQQMLKWSSLKFPCICASKALLKDQSPAHNMSLYSHPLHEINFNNGLHGIRLYFCWPLCIVLT